MSSVRPSVISDDRVRSDASWARIKRSAGLGLLSATVVGSIISFAAGAADNRELPASFRNWYHVNTMVIDKGSPLFEAMGGMHNVYINSTGEPALKKGEPYPDKTVFLVDLHEFTISDGSYVEGPRKATAIMLKDKKKYASTGGWGFQAWAGVIQQNHWSRIPPNNASNVTSRRRTKITCIQPTSRERSISWYVSVPACRLRSGDLRAAMPSPYGLVEHTHDVVGTGGAGLYAPLGMVVRLTRSARQRRMPWQSTPHPPHAASITSV